jgi:hypothetical protein
MLPEEVTAQPVKLSTQAKRTNIGSFTKNDFIINSHCACPEKYMFLESKLSIASQRKMPLIGKTGFFLQKMKKAAPVKAQPLVSRE